MSIERDTKHLPHGPSPAKAITNFNGPPCIRVESKKSIARGGVEDVVRRQGHLMNHQFFGPSNGRDDPAFGHDEAAIRANHPIRNSRSKKLCHLAPGNVCLQRFSMGIGKNKLAVTLRF